MTRDRGTPPCSDEVFVVAWESADSLAEVARVCGYQNAKVASNRATRLRARGVYLRPFMTGPNGMGRRSRSKLNWLARRAGAK